MTKQTKSTKLEPDKREKAFPKGLSEDIIREISRVKDEPEWMLKLRVDAYKHFLERPMPAWGADLSGLDFQEIKYYAYAGEKQGTWDKVPKDIKNTFDKLGVPEIEQKYLAGLTTQYESEAIYHNLKDQWKNMGIIFEDTDSGLKKHPEIFEKFFGKLIPYADNKFAALNTAAWSGGSFIYIPKGVKLWMPVQTYFRINTQQMGQFERTLIIADEDSEIHYIEGCTAPQYMNSSLHSAVVEIFVMKNAKVRYTTIQNWAKNIYNLVTKRAIVEENGTMEWVDCNLGSKVTMKYPSVILKGRKAHGELLSLAMAEEGQNIDSGGKMIHLAPETTSIINSKTISKDNGIATYRGLAKITAKAKNSRTSINCNSLILNKGAKAYAYPVDILANKDSIIEHEATISQISLDQLFYLQSRGFSEAEATKLIVSGFIEPIASQLPMEYSVELERLLEMSLEGVNSKHESRSSTNFELTPPITLNKTTL
jgi:Fe-S cluster assembly protein SufB